MTAPAPAHCTLIQLLDHCQVSTPPGSVPSTSLPLTFLDIPWLLCCPIKRIFFYQFPHQFTDNTTAGDEYFLRTIVPNLKHSLSLTLRLYFPFAGRLICPLRPNEPRLLYVDGDSISFTVAQSEADLDELKADRPQDVKNLHPLLPKLPPAHSDEEGTLSVSLLAVQVTLFSGCGYSIGLTFNHAVSDGNSFHQFLKRWASICLRRNAGLHSLENDKDPMPFYNREVVSDPMNLKQEILNFLWDMNGGALPVPDRNDIVDEVDVLLTDKLRTTISLTRTQIENLKKRVTADYARQSEESEKAVNFSSFAMISALVWVCLVKSEEHDNHQCEESYHLAFQADYRRRKCEFSVATYFGNCLGVCFCSLKKKEITGDNGILEASKAIRNTVLQINDDPTKGTENCLSEYIGRQQTGRLITVAGSPNLGVYGTDFGWGRLKKSEVVHIDVSGSIALSDARDGAGGAEFAIALSRARMNNFLRVFHESLAAN